MLSSENNKYFKTSTSAPSQAKKNVFRRPLTSALINNYMKGNFDIFSSKIAKCDDSRDIEDIVPQKILTELAASLKNAKDTAGPLDWGWYDRVKKGRDPRITQANWFDSSTIPNKTIVRLRDTKSIPDDSLYFYEYTADYSVNRGKIYVNLFGIDADGETCMVRVDGFKPNLTVRVDGYEDMLPHMLEALNAELHKKIDSIIKGKTVAGKFREIRDMKDSGNLQSIVIDYTVTDAAFLQKHDRYYEGRCATISFAHPSIIPIAKELLWYPNGTAYMTEEDFEDDWNNTSTTKSGKAYRKERSAWCPERLLPSPKAVHKGTPVGGFVVYEANIDFLIVFFSNLALTPASWMKVDGGKWELIPLDDFKNRVSSCDKEFIVKAEDLCMADKEYRSFQPVLRYMSWDLEALPPGHFPTPKDSPVLTGAYMIADRGVEENWVHYYVFSLGYLESWAPDVTVFCYDFNDEKIMSEDQRMFRDAVRPQVETGYNIANFDLYFMRERHKVLGCDSDFMDYTYVPSRKAYSTSKKNRNNQVVSSVKASGILTYDMLRHVYEFMNLDNNTLGSAAPKVLDGMTKEEFSYDQIEGAMYTLRGRTIMAQYCLMDARLPYQMMMKLSAISSSFQLANVYHVSPQDTLDQGAQYKVMGRVHYKCINHLEIKRAVRVYIPTYQRKKKSGVKYKGATVLTPVQGFYGGGTVTNQHDSLPKNSMMYKMFSKKAKEDQLAKEGEVIISKHETHPKQKKHTTKKIRTLHTKNI